MCFSLMVLNNIAYYVGFSVEKCRYFPFINFSCEKPIQKLLEQNLGRQLYSMHVDNVFNQENMLEDYLPGVGACFILMKLTTYQS